MTLLKIVSALYHVQRLREVTSGKQWICKMLSRSRPSQKLADNCFLFAFDRYHSPKHRTAFNIIRYHCLSCLVVSLVRTFASFSVHILSIPYNNSRHELLSLLICEGSSTNHNGHQTNHSITYSPVDHQCLFSSACPRCLNPYTIYLSFRACVKPLVATYLARTFRHPWPDCCHRGLIYHFRI